MTSEWIISGKKYWTSLALSCSLPCISFLFSCLNNCCSFLFCSLFQWDTECGDFYWPSKHYHQILWWLRIKQKWSIHLGAEVRILYCHAGILTWAGYLMPGLSFTMHILFCVMFPSSYIVWHVASLGCECVGLWDHFQVFSVMCRMYLMLFYSSVTCLTWTHDL